MYTTSFVSKQSSILECISIEPLQKKNVVDLTPIIKNTTSHTCSREKAIVIDMFENTSINKTPKVDLTYTIKAGDNNRLNSRGDIKVYDHNEPIFIPVGRLLGKWKNTHIGVTLVVINDNWRVKGEVLNSPVYNDEQSMWVAFQRLIKFVMAQ